MTMNDFTEDNKQTAKRSVGRPNFYAQISLLYDKGFVDSEISFELRISQKTVFNWRKLHNKPPNKKKL